MSPFEFTCCSHSESTLPESGLPLCGMQLFTLSRRGEGRGLGLSMDEILAYGFGRWSGLTRVSLPLPALSFGDLPLSELRKWIGLPPVSRTPGH